MKNVLLIIVALCAGSTSAFAQVSPTLQNPAQLPSQISELANQLTSAKEVRFDAIVKSRGSAIPIEVSGTLQGAKDVNVTLSKYGKVVCIVTGNKDGGAVYFAASKVFYPYSPSNEKDAPPGLENCPTVEDSVGEYAAQALYVSETLLRNLSGFVPMPPSHPSLNWTRVEDVENGATVEHESAVVTDSQGNLNLAKSLTLTYTQSPWSLTEAVFTPTGTKSLSDTGFDIKFVKCDLISDDAALTNAKQFAFVEPIGARSFDEIAQSKSSALQPGVVAPNFTAYTPTGSRVRLSAYHGKVVVVDLWATWCSGCILSLPYTDKVAAAYQKKGVVFLPICVWDSRQAFRHWLKQHKYLALAMLFDRAPQGTSFATTFYKVDGLPTQFVVGRNGKIASTFTGYYYLADPHEGGLASALNKALAE